MSEFGFYTTLFNKLEEALGTYVSDVSSSMVEAIGPVTLQLVVLYFILHGLALMRGMIEEPITDFTWRVVRIAIITGLALNTGLYNGEIADFLYTAPDALAGHITGTPYSDTESMLFLDKLMDDVFHLGNIYWSYDSLGPSVDLGPKLIALLVWISGLVLTAYTAFLFSLSKMALSILLALGPVFILLTLFEGTKRFFESWLGQVFNYLFIVVLAAAALKLMLTIIGAFIPAAVTEATIDATFASALPAVAFLIIGALVMMQLSSIASALGGGVALSTLGAGSAVWSKARGAAGGAKNLATRKTLSDMRAARRARETNRRWAERNPGTGRKLAGMPVAVYKKVTATPNRVSNG